MVIFLFFCYFLQIVEINVKPEKTTWKKIYDFLCGIQDDNEIVVRSAKEKLQTLMESTSLNQKKHERILLALGMIFVFIVGVFLIIFFTVPFNTRGRDPVYYTFT